MNCIEVLEPGQGHTIGEVQDAGERLLEQQRVFADAVAHQLRYTFRGHEGDVTCDAREVTVQLRGDALPPLEAELLRTDWETARDGAVIATVRLVAKRLGCRFVDGRHFWDVTYLVAGCE